MKKPALDSVKQSYIMMAAMVFVCAFEYVFAKPILAEVPTLTLIWIKYVLAFFAFLLLKIARGGRGGQDGRERRGGSLPFTKRDILFFVLMAVVGEVLYYVGGFNAVQYIPIALVTVVIALAPALSIVFERLFYKKKARGAAVIGICLSLFGVCMVVGVDAGMLASGRVWGYLLAFVPVVCTNVYNIIALKMAARYTAFDLSLYVTTATMLVCTPFAIGNLPPIQAIDTGFIVGAVFIGIVVGVFGVFAYIKSLSVLGPTTTLMFSNFVPVVTCVFGWLLLGETILPLQMAGGAITLVGCAIVIYYPGNPQAN